MCKLVTVCPGHIWTTLYIVALILTLVARWRWVVNIAPGRFTPEPTEQKVGWTSESVWMIWKIPCPHSDFFRAFFSFFRCPLLSTVYVYIFCPCVPYSSTAHNTNVHAPGVIRTRNPSKRLPADPRLRPLCHWDRRDSNLAMSSPWPIYRYTDCDIRNPPDVAQTTRFLQLNPTTDIHFSNRCAWKKTLVGSQCTKFVMLTGNTATKEIAD